MKSCTRSVARGCQFIVRSDFDPCGYIPVPCIPFPCCKFRVMRYGIRTLTQQCLSFSIVFCLINIFLVGYFLDQSVSLSQPFWVFSFVLCCIRLTYWGSVQLLCRLIKFLLNVYVCVRTRGQGKSSCKDKFIVLPY